MVEPWGPTPSAWTLDGRVIHLARPPLVHLIGLVLAHTPVRVVLGSIRDQSDSEFVAGAILDRGHPLCSEFLDGIADSLVEAWFGMPRWTVQEIWWRALGSWPDIEGELSSRGVDVLVMTPARATNTVRALLLRWVSGDESKADELRRDLATEPPRVAFQAANIEERAEAAAFDWGQALALAQQHRT